MVDDLQPNMVMDHIIVHGKSRIHPFLFRMFLSNAFPFLRSVSNAKARIELSSKRQTLHNIHGKIVVIVVL